MFSYFSWKNQLSAKSWKYQLNFQQKPESWTQLSGFWRKLNLNFRDFAKSWSIKNCKIFFGKFPRKLSQLFFRWPPPWVIWPQNFLWRHLAIRCQTYKILEPFKNELLLDLGTYLYLFQYKKKVSHLLRKSQLIFELTTAFIEPIAQFS